MASTRLAAAHIRSDSGISVHSTVTQNGPPSPTLTNPDMILPRPPWLHDLRVLSPLASSHSLDSDINRSRDTSRNSSQRSSVGPAELGVATAVFMPSRLTAPPPTSILRPQTPPGGLYSGYEHGAPLSDIYEENEATPKSSKASRVSRSPSPTPSLDRPLTPTKNGPTLRHKKRLSALSTSSAGSDGADWEEFDSSKVLSDRVAADIARMLRDEPNETEEEVASKRSSKDEEEMNVLNDQAEQILENARKRLSHMEGNLKVARNSVLMPSRSLQNLLGDHQPVGELYRSISAAGATKLGLSKGKPIFPPLKANSNMRHARGESDTAVPSKKTSRDLQTRSVSALEYNSNYYFAQSPELGSSPSTRFQHSPTSSRSYSALRTLEEEKENTSTTETTPESVKMPPPRGLGIHKLASVSKENLNATLDRPLSRTTPTPTQAQRSSSSASTRSTKELREQMSDLKNRIADLKSQAQSDHLRRRSLQNLKTPNQPDQWYASAPAYQEANGNAINANAGVGYVNNVASVHRRVSSEGKAQTQLSTPINNKFLDVGRLTPGADSVLLGSARTDRNTPTLGRSRHVKNDSMAGLLDEQEELSVRQLSQYEDAPRFQDLGQGDYGDDEMIAENEEEQIYLNEVLEESLREAEVEPQVPMIPAAFLDNMDGSEAERHEDRLDAFDYENMFLHSAMGTYTGKSLDGSQSGSESEEEDEKDEDEEEDDDDDDDSVETSRAGGRTPTNNFPNVDEQDDESEPATDDEMADADTRGKTPDLSATGTPKSAINNFVDEGTPSPAKTKLAPPSKPWLGHSRTSSADSISTAATFQTATEGGHEREEDEQPSDILNWGNSPQMGPSPQRSQHGYTYPTGQAISPYKHVIGDHVFPSPPLGNGRDTPTLASMGSLQRKGSALKSLQPAFNGDRGFSSTRDMSAYPDEGPGLGLGVIGAENAQYINDNGVPERFQGQPSPSHSRQNSKQSKGSSRPKAQSPRGSGHSRSTSYTSNHSRQFSAGQPFSPGLPVPSSPRKFVINQSLRSPESDYATPMLPSQQSHHKSSPSAQSSYSAGSIRSTKAPGSLLYSRPETATPRPGTAPPTYLQVPSAPNTEILMESLIKLVQPSFSLSAGTRFEDVDKDLVLGLLRAVGGVCDSLMRAQTRGGIEDEPIIGVMRERLEGATGVLDGSLGVQWESLTENGEPGLEIENEAAEEELVEAEMF